MVTRQKGPIPAVLALRGAQGGPDPLVLQQAPLDSDKRGIEGVLFGLICSLFITSVM